MLPYRNQESSDKRLFFKSYIPFNLVIFINHLICVFFRSFELFVNILFNDEYGNTFTVGFCLECFLFKLQSNLFAFQVFSVDLFK